MRLKANNGAIAGGLLLAVFLWGANNTGVKYLVRYWPPIAIGSTRFIAAGLVLLGLMRWTNLFGAPSVLSAELKKRLWWRPGVSLATYIVAFNWALKLTALSHVALYLGAAPVWALLWEGWPERNWRSAQRYGAAALAFCGVLVLFLPMLRHKSGSVLGEILGLSCGVLWTNFGVQCRALGRDLTGAEMAAHTFWRAGVLLAPLALIEVWAAPVPWGARQALVQLFCILGGSVVAFALWNHGLRHWKTSQVYLFNNLIPLSNMAWANVCLKEPLTRTFWVSMLLIGAGVLLGQANWQRILGARWLPFD
ncbi:MAG: DMT family transporter [Verrucomicrobiota bacterium]|jgi:drug/metabolite transporter (DMT)-like permease